MSDDEGWLLRRIAHDIRGSAAVVSGALAEVKRSSEDEAYFGMADRGLLRLNRLTELLSSVAEARTTGLASTLTKQSIRALASRAQERALLLNPSRKVKATLVDGPDFAIPLDERWIVQACVELEINALRFASSQVDIKIDGDDSHVTVVFEDDGPGISPDHRPHYPWEGPTLGSGLGMAFARDVARAHGGELLAGPRPDGGTRVALRIPVP